MLIDTSLISYFDTRRSDVPSLVYSMEPTAAGVDMSN
jgi:hypothetical protein